MKKTTGITSMLSLFILVLCSPNQLKALEYKTKTSTGTSHYITKTSLAGKIIVRNVIRK